MVGGDTETFNTVLPYIEFMGSDITLCGPSGAGQAVKLMNNMIVVQTVQAIAEALQVARQSGVVDGKILFETLMTGVETNMDLLEKAGTMDFGDCYYTILIEALEKE